MLRVLSVVALMLPGASWAQNIDGNTVYAQCVTHAGDPTADGFCVGYIMGVWEGIKFGSAVMTVRALEGVSAAEANDFADQLMNTCVPAAVEAGQIVQIATDYMSGNPAERHESARGLIYSAVSQAFPCS